MFSQMILATATEKWLTIYNKFKTPAELFPRTLPPPLKQPMKSTNWTDPKKSYVENTCLYHLIKPT